MSDRRTYVTGVVDQIAAAAAKDDRKGITDILAKVQKEDPAVAKALGEEVVTHGIKGAIARRKK